jgi:hypothetical protein
MTISAPVTNFASSDLVVGGGLVNIKSLRDILHGQMPILQHETICNVNYYEG